MGRAFQLGTIFGIPLRVDYSWFVIFVLVTVLLSLSYFPDSHPLWSEAAYWIVGIATSLLFFASVLAHELAHSLVSIRTGIPVKSITLFIFGGISRIEREATQPGHELKMAAAGPLCSLFLCGLFTAIWWLSEGFSDHMAALAWWLAVINGILAAFNMIPGFPLDGGRVFRSIVWIVSGSYMRATRIATSAGLGISYLFIVGGIFMLFFLVGGQLNGLWLILIGWFLNSAARRSYQQTKLLATLKGFKAKEVMARDYPTVPRHLTLKELVQGQLMLTRGSWFMVTDGERIEGLLTLRQVKEVPQEEWDVTTIGQAMIPVAELRTAAPSDDATSVLELMSEDSVNVVAVVDGGRVLGVILRDDLIQFAQRLQSLRA